MAEESADSTVDRKMNITAYPYVFYTPETELAFGAGGIMTFYTASDALLRPSKVGLSGYYSTLDQYQLSISPEVYFNKNRLFVGSRFAFGHYVDRFYGIGKDTPDLGTEDYTMDNFEIELDIEGPPFIFISDRSGFLFEYQNTDIVDTKDNLYLTNGDVIGEDGGQTVGIGGIWSWDRRDNIFFPNSGEYHRVSILYYSEGLGGDFTFVEFEFEERYYYPFAPDQIFAINFYYNGVSGDVPFYKLPALGGQNRMRGYFKGRYRDKQYLMGQMEYRRYFWWRLGFVAFVGAGDVAPEITKFTLNTFKYSYGAGLRFLFNKAEKVNLRMDLGFGKDTNGIYFGLEEAF
jgi:outer membrane protein assembly factor BamA